MLGKGLESLIPPQKGNQQNSGSQNSNSASNPASAPAQQPPVEQQPPVQSLAQPSQPVVHSQPQAQPQSQQQPQQSRPQFQVPKQETPASESVYQLEIDKIVPNPDQPRRNFNQEALRELGNSIREFGLLQPIVVSKVEKETPTGVDVEYQIIAGERRYLASRLIGLRLVPAIIRNVSLEREKLELAVIENIQRENLNPIETARAFQRLQEEFRMTQREIAVKLGKSREVVANTMRLLDLPEYVRVALQEGTISESHARLLLGVQDAAAQQEIFTDIVQNKLTTRDVRVRIEQHHAAANDGDPNAPRRGRPPLEDVHLAPEVKALQDELSSSLGTPVEIKKGGSTGHITINFYSEEELENILRILKKEQEM